MASERWKVADRDDDGDDDSDDDDDHAVLQVVNKGVDAARLLEVLRAKHVERYKHVWLSRNGLESLPLQLVQSLSHVRTLVLDGNLLRRLPEQMPRLLCNLEGLRLDENRLEALPSTATCLSRLRLIWLRGNMLPPQVRLLFQAGVSFMCALQFCVNRYGGYEGVQALLGQIGAFYGEVERRRGNCIRTTLCLLGVLRSKRAQVCSLGKDVLNMIAQLVWLSREDIRWA